jgi:hypothetical protein
MRSICQEMGGRMVQVTVKAIDGPCCGYARCSCGAFRFVRRDTAERVDSVLDVWYDQHVFDWPELKHQRVTGCAGHVFPVVAQLMQEGQDGIHDGG